MIMSIVIFQIIVILIVFLILGHLAKINKALHLEKRIGSYALDVIKDEGFSFFDRVSIILLKIIKYISRIIRTFPYFRHQALKYEKFIAYEDKKEKNSIDYVAIKLLLSLILGLGNILITLVEVKMINVLTLLISLIIGYYLYDILINIKHYQYTKKLEEDLLRAIVIMNSSFKSGNNIVQSINAVINQLEGPIQDEFKKINMDINYGLSLDIVFDRFYGRTNLEDAKYMSVSLAILNKTGGNIIKVFNTIEKSIYNRKTLRTEMRTLSASSIFMFRFLLFIPVILVLILLILNPTYFNVLFKSILGIILFSLIIILFTSYIFIIRKLMKVNI